MGQEIASEVAPRVYGKFGLGFSRSPFDVIRCEILVSGDYLRSVTGTEDLRTGMKVTMAPPGQPAMEAIIIERLPEISEPDFYLLDWRTSRQPRAIPVQA